MTDSPDLPIEPGTTTSVGATRSADERFIELYVSVANSAGGLMDDAITARLRIWPFSAAWLVWKLPRLLKEMNVEIEFDDDGQQIASEQEETSVEIESSDLGRAVARELEEPKCE